MFPYATDHGIASVGYVLKDADRPGRLDAAKARLLGIEGREMTLLKSGHEVRGVRLEDVMSPAIPGHRVAYSGDTRPCLPENNAIRGVDVLIHESTYMNSESRQADEHFHTTALQAAHIARQAGVRHLILTHISNRYDDRSVVLEEALSVFPDTYMAEDMEHFELTTDGLRLKENAGA